MDETPGGRGADHRSRTVGKKIAKTRSTGKTVRSAQVEITERSDRILDLRPAIAVPADQQWFWDKRWQEGERRADADIAAGRNATYDNVDDFMDSLEVDE
ncbi:hypothetical protein [Actinoplanes sp. HUAS TT8]|uniref:hypothetical protein n=1 Tax=Actinoplanes sp. HUAS TT8 TaxID=3447453 RepID=UPI003F52160B